MTTKIRVPRVVVLGAANVDVVVQVERRPDVGETVLGSDTVLASGGKGANAAVAAALLGAEVALLGAVGDDQNGRLLTEAMTEAGVAMDLVAVTTRASGAAYITVTPDGENTIVVSPGANSTVTVARVEQAADTIASAAVLLASLEVPIDAVERAVSIAATADVRPVVNLSPVASLSTETLAELDPLVVNEHEAGWLLGGMFSAERLLSLGPRSAVVTLGARGALVVESTGVTEVPAPRVRVVDTTGAGDCFVGSMAMRLGEGASLVDAVGYAARVAALSVTRPGTQRSYPTRHDVLAAEGGEE